MPPSRALDDGTAALFGKRRGVIAATPARRMSYSPDKAGREDLYFLTCCIAAARSCYTRHSSEALLEEQRGG